MRPQEEESFEVLRALGEQLRVRLGLLSFVGIILKPFYTKMLKKQYIKPSIINFLMYVISANTFMIFFSI